MEKPAIKRVPDPGASKKAMSQFVVGGLAPLISSLSRAVDIAPHEREALRVVLRNKLGLAGRVRARAGWIGGRFYNRLAGEDPDYVDLSGVHLCQALEAAGWQSPEAVEPGRTYLLRTDLAEAAVRALEDGDT